MPRSSAPPTTPGIEKCYSVLLQERTFDSGQRAEMAPDRKKVFLVYGRDQNAFQKVMQLLNQYDLQVVEWEDAIAETKVPNPYIGDIVKAGMRLAQAFVVILSPDDDAKLKRVFHYQESKGSPEKRLMGQPRPNVLYEAGFAMGIEESRTILIEVGTIRRITDIDGRHLVRTSNNKWCYQLFRRLRIAGCDISDAKIVDDRDCREIEPMKEPPTGKPTRGPDYQVPKSDNSKKLQDILTNYGGPTQNDWRTNSRSKEYPIMKAAEEEAQRHPFRVGERVYIQQHYKSPFNGKFGYITKEWRRPYHYWVEFKDYDDLPDTAFHVMYLTRCD